MSLNLVSFIRRIYQKDRIISQQICMDPRPVDFSYRRPRLNNLTYQSYGLSESLFHIGSYGKQYILTKKPQRLPVDETLRANPQKLIHEPKSKWNVKQQQLNHSYIYENPSSYSNVHTRRPRENLSKSVLFDDRLNRRQQSDRRNYGIEQLARTEIKNEADSLSNYTYQLMKTNKKGEGQDRVYQIQQKPYNIISLTPKPEPDVHRQYPRFSLQHKLIANNSSQMQSEGKWSQEANKSSNYKNGVN